MPPRRWTIHARLAGAALAGCLVILATAPAMRAVLGVSATLAWTVALLFAAIMATALQFAAEHPFDRLGPANRVTIVRAMLAAFVLGLIGEEPVARLAEAAATAAAVSAALDGVDGWLARRSRMASTFGARFDMETDALIIFGLSILVWRHDKAGVWIVACGVLRYAFVVAGWLMPWMAGPLTPTLRGKAVAVSQVIGLGIALALLQPPASVVVAAATLAALVWSFGVDVGRLWRQRTDN